MKLFMDIYHHVIANLLQLISQKFTAEEPPRELVLPSVIGQDAKNQQHAYTVSNIQINK